MGCADNLPYKAGEKGRNRVRAFVPQDKATENIYLEFWVDGTRKRKSTGHQDEAKAKRQADELAAKFATLRPGEAEELRLGPLLHRFRSAKAPDVTEQRSLVHDRVAEALTRFYGPEFRIEELTKEDWKRYARKRQSGAIDARGNPVPEGERNPVGARSAREDLQVLRAACKWAVGEKEIDTDPTAEYPLPREKNPKRPVISERRYQAMLAVADEVDWRFKLALIVVEGTGHRISAVLDLRWSDIQLKGEDKSLIHWRERSDKVDNAHVTPLKPGAAQALADARDARDDPDPAEWVFPAPRKEGAPCPRSTMDQWWDRAEELARLEDVAQLGWHGLRRKFGTERKHIPDEILAAVGGWKSTDVIQQCYQDTSLAEMRQALEDRQPAGWSAESAKPTQ